MICPRCGQQIDSFPYPNCGFPETLNIKQTERKRRSSMPAMKRKTISILLAIMMMVAFAPPAFAFAEETPADDTAPVDQQVPDAVSEDGEPSHDIADYTFKLSQDKFFYNGKPQKPDVICEELPEDAYSVEYQIDQGAGTTEPLKFTSMAMTPRIITAT